MNRVLLFAALTLSCIHGAEQPAGYPLYQNAGVRLPRDKVAELVTSMPGAESGAGSGAFIKRVDGKEVSGLDTAFELTPGCHIVETASQLMISNGVVSLSGELGARTFAFQMKPGHTYIVKVVLQEGNGASGRVLIYAIEQDQAGRDVQRIETAKSEQEVRTCVASGGN